MGSTYENAAREYQAREDAPPRSHMSDAAFAVARDGRDYTARIIRMASARHITAVSFVIKPSQCVEDEFDGVRLDSGEYERIGHLKSSRKFWVVRSVQSGDEFILDRIVGVSLLD